jgi:HPt (histidine-containing phosphotransfer) domain-containing protein
MLDQGVLDQRVLDLLRSELKGAAAGVIREFMVEMEMIRDQFAIELKQEYPRPDVIAQNAHRLLGAARTLGARQLGAQTTALQKSLPSETTALSAEDKVALARIMTEIETALLQLEAFFQAKLVGAEAGG